MKIAPLKWVETNGVKGMRIWDAVTPTLRYSIGFKVNFPNDGYAVVRENDGASLVEVKTWDEAAAAAWSDYERRILSSFVPPS